MSSQVAVTSHYVSPWCYWGWPGVPACQNSRVICVSLGALMDVHMRWHAINSRAEKMKILSVFLFFFTARNLAVWVFCKWFCLFVFVSIPCHHWNTHGMSHRRQAIDLVKSARITIHSIWHIKKNIVVTHSQSFFYGGWVLCYEFAVFITTLDSINMTILLVCMGAAEWGWL